MADDTKLQFVQLLNHWLCYVQSGIVMGKDWALSVDQCWLQALQFSMHLIDLLSILLRCNGFTKIQKAMLDQMGSRPPNSDHHFLVQVWLWEVLWSVFSVQPVSCSSLLTGQSSHKIHFSSHVTIRLRNCWFTVAQNKRRQHFRMTICLIFSQFRRYPLTKFFHLSNLPQMPIGMVQQHLT